MFFWGLEHQADALEQPLQLAFGKLQLDAHGVRIAPDANTAQGTRGGVFQCDHVSFRNVALEAEPDAVHGDVENPAGLEPPAGGCGDRLLLVQQIALGFTPVFASGDLTIWLSCAHVPFPH